MVARNDEVGGSGLGRVRNSISPKRDDLRERVAAAPAPLRRSGGLAAALRSAPPRKKEGSASDTGSDFSFRAPFMEDWKSTGREWNDQDGDEYNAALLQAEEAKEHLERRAEKRSKAAEAKGLGAGLFGAGGHVRALADRFGGLASGYSAAAPMAEDACGEEGQEEDDDEDAGAPEKRQDPRDEGWHTLSAIHEYHKDRFGASEIMAYWNDDVKLASPRAAKATVIPTSSMPEGAGNGGASYFSIGTSREPAQPASTPLVGGDLFGGGGGLFGTGSAGISPPSFGTTIAAGSTGSTGRPEPALGKGVPARAASGRRKDPHDGELYSFEEVVARYGRNGYSEDECWNYWENEMTVVPSATATLGGGKPGMPASATAATAATPGKGSAAPKAPLTPEDRRYNPRDNRWYTSEELNAAYRHNSSDDDIWRYWTTMMQTSAAPAAAAPAPAKGKSTGSGKGGTSLGSPAGKTGIGAGKGASSLGKGAGKCAASATAGKGTMGGASPLKGGGKGSSRLSMRSGTGKGAAGSQQLDVETNVQALNVSMRHLLAENRKERHWRTPAYFCDKVSWIGERLDHVIGVWKADAANLYGTGQRATLAQDQDTYYAQELYKIQIETLEFLNTDVEGPRKKNDKDVSGDRILFKFTINLHALVILEPLMELCQLMATKYGGNGYKAGKESPLDFEAYCWNSGPMPNGIPQQQRYN